MLKDRVEVIAIIAGLAASAWMLMRFLFKPFCIWALTELGREAFKTEFAAAAEAKHEMEQLRQEVTTIKSEIGRTADACERVEKAVARLADNVMELAKQVGRVQGAQGASALGVYSK